MVDEDYNSKFRLEISRNLFHFMINVLLPVPLLRGFAKWKFCVFFVVFVVHVSKKKKFDRGVGG